MINPTSNNPAYYSEKNDTSPFRFVLMTSNRFDSEKVVEHKCSLCGTVQIQDGFSYNLPGGFVQIICNDCYCNEIEFTSYCESCDAALNDDNHYDTYDVCNDWDLPQGMEHRASICTDCMNRAEDTDNLFTLNTTKETSMDVKSIDQKIEDCFDRIEDKLDSLLEYMRDRKQVIEDYDFWKISAEELDDQLNVLMDKTSD